MIATYIQRGESLDYKNATGDVIPAGSVINLKSRIGVAGTDIGPGEIGSVHVTGVFAIAKETGSIDMGAPLYYDAESGKVKTEGSAGTIPAGYAAGPAVDQDPTVPVNIGFPVAAPPSTPESVKKLSELEDVEVGSAAEGYVLKYKSSKWTATEAETIPKKLTDLSDVEISSPSDKQVLKYENSSTKWKNQADETAASEAV